MAAEYFLYTTDYNNTLVDRSDTSFSPAPPYNEILIDYFIPNIQPLYLYRNSGGTGGTIVLNDQATINAYLEGTAAAPQGDDEVLQYEFTGYTATTKVDIEGRVNWENVWTGGTHVANDMVTDNGWTMVANKTTTDRPAPQAVGDEQYLYYPLIPSGTSTSAKQIVFGMQYSGDSAYWLNGYRIYVTAGNSYEIITVEDPQGHNEVTFVNTFTAEVTGWRTFGLIPKPVASGTTYQILAIVHEPDPTPITLTYNYDYIKPNNIEIPTSGQITHAGKDLSSLLINKTDDDSVDRSVTLTGLTTGDFISIGFTTWAIQLVSDEGSYIDYTIAPARQSISSGVVPVDFETTIASTLSYSKDLNYWSGSTTVKGVIGINTGWEDATLDDSQYGVDILVQNAYVSPDWDFVTSNDSGNGSSVQNPYWGTIQGDISNQEDLQEELNIKTNYEGNGVTSGFTISINGGDNTKIDIAAGIGYVIDNYTNPENPILNKIMYSGTTGIPVTNIAINVATYIAIDNNGDVIQQTSPYSIEQRRDYIILGAAIHSNNVFINVINNLPDVVLDSHNQLNDLIDGLNNFNIDGNKYSSSGDNLSIDKTEGNIFKRGVNFNVDNRNPHIKTLASLKAPSNIRYRLSDSTEFNETAFIDVVNYENPLGIRTAVSADKYTVQRITVFSSNLTRIQYGQHEYDSIDLAVDGIQKDTFAVEQNIAENGLLRAYLIVKQGITGLTGTTSGTINTIFFEADKFGTSPIGGSGVAETNWGSVTDKPQWLSATTLNEFQTGHTHSHSDLTDLNVDSHSQYALLTGRSGDTLNIDSISGFTGNTVDFNNNRITNLGTPINAGDAVRYDNISGVTTLYDGIDTQANILALSPTTYSGETWFANDTKKIFKAFSVTTTGTDEWQGLSLYYDEATDTYKLSETADGQTQNLGQETFINAYNNGISGTTAAIPRAFIGTGFVVGNESFANAQFALSTDISLGSTYGINTTSAATGEYFKFITYGLVNDVDTSAWVVGTVLFASDTVAGLLVESPPTNNPTVFGIVRKQDAVTGKIFVNTIRQISQIAGDANVPLNFTYNYFTGDAVTGITGTNYYILPNDKGVVTELVEIKVVADNTRADLDVSWLTDTGTTDVFFSSGVYDGRLDIEVNNTGANERIYIEVYSTDGDGTPKDSNVSGMTSGFTYPTLRPIMVIQSSLLNLDSAFSYSTYMSGNLLEDYNFVSGDRMKFIISVEKVGTGGGTKEFTIRVGTDYNCYVRSPYTPKIGELDDVNTVSAVDNDVLIYDASGQTWNSSKMSHNYLSDLTVDTHPQYALLDGRTGDTLNIEKINLTEYNNTVPATGDLWYSGNNLTFNNGDKSFKITPLVLANPNYINVDKSGYGDFTTFYDAINSIPTGSSENYLISFVPNTYVETNQIVIPSNVLIQFNSAVIFFAGVAGDCITYTDVNRTTMNGGYLLTSTGHTNALINILDSNNLLFENMFFIEGNIGLRVEATTGITQALTCMSLCKFFTGMTTGLKSINTDDLALINVENSAQTGYEFIDSNNVVISTGGIRFCSVVGINTINSDLLISGLSIREAYDAIHLHSGSTLNGSLIIEDSVNLDILQVDSDCVVDLTNSKLNQYKLNISNWSNFAADYDNDVPTERAYHYNKDVHVGTPEYPRELVAGEGNSIGRETIVYTYSPTTGYTNVSYIATDTSTGTTVGFPANTVDNAVYFSTDIIQDGDKYKFGGLKGSFTELGQPGTGGYQYEYWNGTIWKHFNRMITDRDSPYQSYAENLGLFQGTLPHTFQFRFDSAIFDDWTKNDPMSAGIDRYWMRIRIYAEVDASWEVYSVKVHTNRTEINCDGFIEYFGKGRPIKKLPLQVNSFKPAINSPSDQDLFYSKGLYAGRTENSFGPNGIDSVGYMGYLPFDIDTSSELIFKIAYVPSSSGEGFLKSKLTWGIMSIGDEIFGSSGSAPISAATENVVESYLGISANTENKIQEFRITGIKIPDAIAQKADLGTDMIAFTLYREGSDAGDTYNGSAVVIDIGVYYKAWRAGGHTEIF